MRNDERNKYMKLSKKLIILVLMLTLTAAGISSCGKKNSGDGNSTDAAGNYDFSYSDRDFDASYDEASAAKITLSDDKISISGEGAKANGSSLCIEEEGTYIITGSMSDGQIRVETADDEKVQLVLNGINISCSDNAPVIVEESDKVFITLADGSKNTLTGPETYSEAASSDGTDGVIFSRADLCINGSGSLTVTADGGHGIVSKDNLIVTDGNISVTAAGDGIQGKDCVKIGGGNLTVTAADDGIKSSNSDDADRGFISIDSGNVTVAAGCDGIQAETLLRVADGILDITTGGGSGTVSTDSGWSSGWGMRPDHTHDGGQMPDQMNGSTAQSDSETDSDSAKGLKGGLGILVEGGSISIDSSDDSIHSNGDVNISGGKMNMTSGDDGVHADSDLIITSGTVNIKKSYEGLEGNTVIIKDGTINVTASDDGLNAAGGNDSSSVDGRAGQNEFAEDESAYIEILGGTLTANASGDGIDSNGDLTITGGTVYLSGPENSGNGTMDYAGEGLINGGSVIMTGSSGMAMTFDENSEQYSLFYGFSSAQMADSEVSLKDSSGSTLLSFTPAKAYTSAIFSCSGMEEGKEYTVCVDGQEVETVTLSSVSTSAGSSAGQMDAAPGGGMNNGGAHPGGMPDDRHAQDIKEF